MYFWFPWVVDFIVALSLLVFFVIGLSDGSVSSDNSGLWLLMFLVVAGVLGGSFALRAAAHETLAIILAAMLAVPSTLVGLGFLAMIVLPGRWN